MQDAEVSLGHRSPQSFGCLPIYANFSARFSHRNRASGISGTRGGGSGSGVTPTGGLSVEDETETAFEVTRPVYDTSYVCRHALFLIATASNVRAVLDLSTLMCRRQFAISLLKYTRPQEAQDIKSMPSFRRQRALAK